MNHNILGISAFYHDSAAALVTNGEIVAAAQEERFSRIKHDPNFPINAVKYVLDQKNISLDDVSCIVFYDKPMIKFERLIETYHGFAPRGLKSFLSAMPVWLKEKLFMKKLIREELQTLGEKVPKIYFSEHHLSHAASAFYPSPFEEAAILTIDGVGEWATTTISYGEGSEIRALREIHFPHSLGLLYSAFTYYCGFKVNSGEYKLMGLAPYGDSAAEQTREFVKKIYDNLIDLRPDGSFLLNMRYFEYATGDRMCNDSRWQVLFGIKKREPESELTQAYMNLALACQIVTEDVVLLLAKTARKLTDKRNLVMAGGVALNCVANGKLLKSGLFKDIWIQPAAGDAGGAVGAALAGSYLIYQQKRMPAQSDRMNGSYLGPNFDSFSIAHTCRKYAAPYIHFEKYEELINYVSDRLIEGKVVGWFQGRMEFGPRALGNRSILADPRNPDMQKKLNLKIKYREGFRPFAPSVLAEDIQKYFEINSESPYMLMVAPVTESRRNQEPSNYQKLSMMERLYHLRSDVPAITHIDYSARIQSVNRDVNERYWSLINKFKEKTGYGLLVNTSFNVRGEPIVCTPEDAYRCFMRTEMDVLVLGDFVLDKSDQPEFKDLRNWKEEFVLD